MKTSRTIIITALLFIGAAARGWAQDEGRIVFTDPKTSEQQTRNEDDLRPRAHAWGVDLMIGNDGFGFGTFYGMTFDDLYTVSASLGMSEIKDNRQVDYYSYTGEEYSPNKLNRVFRIPLFFSLQYRLFKDDIVENFRPYISGGAGPVLLYITSASREFFSSLSHGAARYTWGGFVGAGAQFGFDRSSILGLNIRYLFIPLPKGVQSVEQGPLPNGNGFFIALNLGLSF